MTCSYIWSEMMIPLVALWVWMSSCIISTYFGATFENGSSRMQKGSLHNDDLYAKELARLKELISNPEDKAECPEIEMRDIRMPDGSIRQFRVSKGLITFQNDSGESKVSNYFVKNR